MSDTPETIAAVLAEMRAAAKSTDLFDGEEVGEPLIRGTKVEEWADRIEAAAERERDEDRQLAAIAESDEAFARCARCDRPERVPGNAAALREALEVIANEIRIWRASIVGITPDERRLLNVALAALAAPARNCDVSRDAKETIERCLASLNVESSSASFDAGVCAAICWMLADQAEGGRE